ncbi:helix-turn-helix transcriptional regulator [Flavobacteriaceae bacterium XHP0103]|uniref:winged helix-turn-helix transcriptional regulator n=1 Tax=Marixanthotalea marina TaxID=2844359 RepID=UPI002989A00F|nr:helix-turn-helix domain-containing protein [Marixanthotalea marina]MBU3820735.1 helix-turn-helix transcriptional regulator [Marixanthotalea marina]
MKAKNKPVKFRSDCPISSALDLFGDTWSLLLVRDMVYFGARTFKDFSEAAEGISSARLSDRLTKLESLGIITKKKHRSNKKVYLYQLTTKGYDLFPVIADLVLWSHKYLNHHISDAAKQFANMLEDDREGTINMFLNK